MSYLLRKLIGKFIILKTSSEDTFKGKVIGIFQDALVIQGIRKTCSEKPIPSNTKTYNIAIGHIIWFEEKDSYNDSSPSNLTETNISETLTNDIAIDESIEVLESLFGTVETLLETEIKNSLKITPNFYIKFEDEFNFEDENDKL